MESPNSRQGALDKQTVTSVRFWQGGQTAVGMQTEKSAIGDRTADVSPGITHYYFPLKTGFHPVPKEHHFDKTTTGAMQTHKKLKGARRTAPSDAAGLLNGTQLHGRTTPLKAPVPPPPSDNEVATVRRKAWVLENAHLMKATRDLLGQYGFHGVAPATDKSSKRVNNSIVQSEFSLSGGGVVVEGEVVPGKKARGWGSGGPEARYQSTFERVIGTGESVPRPSSRPAKIFGRKVNLAPQNHEDVLQYRYDGQGAKEYKLDARRSDAPQTSYKDALCTPVAFNTSCVAYNLNRSNGVVGRFLMG